MNAPPINTVCRMFCRHCGYALIGLPSNRCPECGKDFDPANPKTFRTHPPRVVLRRIIKIVVVLFCLSLPADAYFGQLAWQCHRETVAIKFLKDRGGRIWYYDTRPSWAKTVLPGRVAWLWQRAQTVSMYWAQPVNIHQGMAAIGNLKSLQQLYLGGYTDADGDLVNLEGLTALECLYLNGARVTDAGLAHLKGLAALQKLHLGGMKVTNAGFVNLKGLTALKELSINDTKVTDAGLVNLKGLTALELLELSDMEVTDAGLVNLKGLTALKVLFLGNTKITNAGLVNLEGLTALKNLWLTGTKVTYAGEAKLRTTLPNCAIVP